MPCFPLHRYWLRCVRVVIWMLYASLKRTVRILILCCHGDAQINLPSNEVSLSVCILTFGLCRWCLVLWCQTCWCCSTRRRAPPCQRARPPAAASTRRPPKSGCSGGSACYASSTGGWMSRSSCLRPSRKVWGHPRLYWLLGMKISKFLQFLLILGKVKGHRFCSASWKRRVNMPCGWPVLFSLSVSVLRGLPRQTWPVCQGVRDAANESGLLHAHAIHTSCAVGLLSGPKVSKDPNNDAISP